MIGIECRTSNSLEAAPYDIPKHWEKFLKEDVISQIPNKISNEVIALYCNYEGDYSKPYSLILGCPVKSLAVIPQGMVAKTVPPSTYAVFSAVGEHPKTVIDTWNHIWQQFDAKRTYTGDYEVYREGFAAMLLPQVDVYIAIE